MGRRRDEGPGAPGPSPSFPVGTVTATCSATVVAALPGFLVGAFALPMRDELGFTAAGTGAAVSAFFVASALAAPVVGRVVQGAGPLRPLRAGALGTAAALTGIAVAARSWLALAALLAVAGVTNSVGQTASNLAIAERRVPSSEGVVFGVKQAAVPLATAVAGLAVPLVLAFVGWRWGFALGASLAAVVGVGAPVLLSRGDGPRGARPSGSRPRSRSEPVDWGMVLPIAGGAFFSAGIAVSIATFLVEFAVVSGWPEGAAGSLLAVGSLLAAVARVLLGWGVDRRGIADKPHATLLVAATMLAGGVVGLLLLVLSQSVPWLLAVGALCALGIGWGWPGLIHLSVVSLNRGAAAAASGALLAGIFGGGVVLPPAVGLLIDHLSYTAAWWACAVALSVPAAAFVATRRALLRRARREALA